MLKITEVAQGSIGEELGLETGDEIINFNGAKECDILDYIYFDSAENFTLSVKKQGKNIEEFDIEKYADETLGLTFDQSAEMVPHTCRNKCLFCFVDQLPKNLRDTLYIKDDDYRLSFVTGNYVTLTNLSKEDITRITEKRFSPLYISVHATDPEVRCKLLSNRFAGNIMELLQKFADSGIEMHCQIVLCPGLNDGEVLRRTIEDLYSLYPRVKSLAVVPAGLTSHREGLFTLKPVTEEDAKQAIKICSEFDKEFVYCSDELYLRANISLPPYESYSDFEQIENGVGLIRKFEAEFYEVFGDNVPVRRRDVIIVTGTSAYGFIKKLTDDFCNKYNVGSIEVAAITNRFFGESVTVSGLVTGGDIIKALKDKSAGKEVIIPRSMLKEFESVFLDGIEVSDLEKALKADVKVCDVFGYSFFDALTGEI